MKQVHFHGKIRVICKRAEYIDGGMHDDAGQKAFAAIKNRDKKEAYRDRKDDLTQVIDKIHAAAVEQVDNMSDAESHAGDDNGGSYVILCDGDKQEASEYHLFQETDEEHAHDVAGRFHRRIIEGDTIPEVSRCKDHKRQVEEEPPCRNGGFAKPIPFQQIVFSDKNKKNNCLQNAENSTCRVSNSYYLIQWICERLQDTINHDPYNRKSQLVFFIQSFHFISSIL